MRRRHHVLGVVVFWGALFVASVLLASRNPKKCGKTVVRRAERVQARGGGRIVMPKGCPVIQLPAGYFSRKARDGSVLIYNEQDPTHWLGQMVMPDQHGVVRYADGHMELWDHGRLVGTLTMEKE